MHFSGRAYPLAVLAALLLCGLSPAGTRHVQAGRPIQAVLDAAQRGDTVIVGPGSYDGNLLLATSLSLIGEGKPVIRGTGSGSVVTISADSCLLRGMVIEHGGGMLVEEDAGILVTSAANRIEQCELRDILFGVYLLHAEFNVVVQNRITGRHQLDLGERGSGIHIWNSRGNRFIGNVISDARDGFYIQNAGQTFISDNEVFNLRYGLHYMYADSNTFLRNIFHDNVAGAAIMYSRGIVMRHNVFMHNRGFASFGILFQDCHDLIADSNIIADNVVGMFFEASTHNVFRSNLIARNDVALEMFQNSGGNVFTRNAFIDNLSPIQLVGKRTGAQWSEGGVGNYWSGYDGFDLDGDRVGDVPMKIQDAFQYVIARNQNLRLYLYSPASQALGGAMEAFPILALNEEADPFPLMDPPPVAGWPAMSLVQRLDVASRQEVGAFLPLFLAAIIGGFFHRLVRRGA